MRTATNASYNATIAPGGTANLGLIGTLPTTANGTPTTFTLSGTGCTPT